MGFLGSGIPIGTYWGIRVRLHFTLLLFAYYRVQQYQNFVLGLGFVVAIYLCILLHEFGHALAARWCDGEATDILLWPLGGLAFVRPAFNPTAHLITTVAGPFVTLVLWIGLGAAAAILGRFETEPSLVFAMLSGLSWYNGFILLFNLINHLCIDNRSVYLRENFI